MAYSSHRGSSVQGQTLEMDVAGCYNLGHGEWFSRQDPYVVIEYAEQKFRTRTDIGKNPSFNETFKLALIEGLREVNASVWNSNTIERDDYIDSTKIILNKVIDTGYDDTQWSLTNSRTGKSSGSLKLILHYAASARTKPGKPEGSWHGHGNGAPPAPMYGAPPAPMYSAPPAPAVPMYNAQPAPAPAYGPALPCFHSAPLSQQKTTLDMSSPYSDFAQILESDYSLPHFEAEPEAVEQPQTWSFQNFQQLCDAGDAAVSCADGTGSGVEQNQLVLYQLQQQSQVFPVQSYEAVQPQVPELQILGTSQQISDRVEVKEPSESIIQPYECLLKDNKCFREEIERLQKEKERSEREKERLKSIIKQLLH